MSTIIIRNNEGEEPVTIIIEDTDQPLPKPLTALALPQAAAILAAALPCFDIEETRRHRRNRPHGSGARTFSYNKWEKKQHRRSIAKASRRRNRRK